MKIGILGNYGHDNNGDEAILQGIILQLTNELRIPSKDIVIFSNNPANTNERYGLDSVKLLHKKGSLPASILTTILQNRKIIQKLDLLIIGGGGLLMDMYKRDAPLYTSHALLGKLTGCEVIVYGVGAGPIQTKLGTFLIKLMVKCASTVSVRDVKSKALLKKIGVTKPVGVIADPAFRMGDNMQRKATSEIKSIGVTAVPYFSKDYWPTSDEDKYRSYINGMAKNLDQVIEKNGVHITFFSTKFPQDIKATEEIYSAMKNKEQVEIMKENLHPDKLVSLCQKQDIIIGTRLHSLILSVAVGTPIIGIGYHQKVHNFMERIEKESYSIHIEGLHQDSLLLNGMVENYNENWIKEQEEFAQISRHQQEEVKEGMKQIQQALL